MIRILTGEEGPIPDAVNGGAGVDHPSPGSSLTSPDETRGGHRMDTLMDMGDMGIKCTGKVRLRKAH